MSHPVTLTLETRTHCNPGWPETQRSSCLCLQSAGIKGVRCYIQSPIDWKVLVSPEPTGKPLRHLVINYCRGRDWKTDVGMGKVWVGRVPYSLLSHICTPQLRHLFSSIYSALAVPTLPQGQLPGYPSLPALHLV